MLIGTITHINHKRAMFIIQVDSGDYVVFELLSGIDIEVGNKISGHLHGLGGESLTHVDSGEVFDAYGQSGPSSLRACMNIL